MIDQLLTAEQLAERWQVKESHVYRLTRNGLIPAVKLGRYYRYRVDAIERFEKGEWPPVPSDWRPDHVRSAHEPHTRKPNVA